MIYVILLALFAVEVQAQSLLGLCHKDWRCSHTVEMLKHKESITTGWIENTFNKDCPCGDKLLLDQRFKTIRVHLINSPCMRNKRCGSYEVLFNETAASASKKIIKGDRKLLRKYDAVLARFKSRIEGVKNLQCYLSPCLECDLNKKARKILLDKAAKAVPQCILVDNPYRQPCMPGYVCEKHGINPKISPPCIVDLDGIDGSTVNVHKWITKYQKCDIQYYWEPWMNCIRSTFIDPRKRNCKYDSSIFEYTEGVICQYYSHLSFDTCLH